VAFKQLRLTVSRELVPRQTLVGHPLLEPHFTAESENDEKYKSIKVHENEMQQTQDFTSINQAMPSTKCRNSLNCSLAQYPL
jgi:hypothetical protein